MSFGTSSGNPGSSGQVDIQHVRKQLHSLLELLDWSYVTLWSFNPQSRSLEWTGGHFAGSISPAQGHADPWSTHLFNLQETCTFTPGRGSVGKAFAEQRNIWMNGPSVHFSAGSDVQARILQHARIETAVYIPSAEAVLELGTSKSMAKDMQLMNNICDFMWEHILPALGHAQAPSHVSQSPLAPLLGHESHEFLSQGFELQEQARRAPSLNINRMLLQYPNEDEALGISSNVPSESTWIPSPTTSRSTNLLQSPMPALPVSAASHQALMKFASCRSLSGTTSSSLSSLEDSSVKLSVDSPEQGISLMAPSSQRLDSHNYASSSARREPPPHSGEFQLAGITGIPETASHLHDIQHLMRQMLGSHQESGPQIPYSDPSLEPGNLPGFAFKIWRNTHVPRRRGRSANQGLLRRSFEILRQNRKLQQSNPPRLQEAAVPSWGSRPLPSSSSPEDMPARDLLEAGPSRVTGRTRRLGTPGSGTDEAAKHHMLSERLRRKKQKESFAALRQLVPIISKNDKASILCDAIIYIKDLREQIQEAQERRAELQRRYEALQSSHQELQGRNEQLEALVVAVTSSGGASSILPPP